MKVFNVWVVIEEQDVKSGNGCDVGLPDKLYESKTLKDAKAFVRSLPGWADQGDTSDYRETVWHPGSVFPCTDTECTDRHETEK